MANTSRVAVAVRRALIVVHRWLGVALSLLFMLWFASGIVMMYRSFPEITAVDRLAHAPRLVADQIRITPERAAAAAGMAPDASASLTSFDGRPVYRFTATGGAPRRRTSVMVFADDGQRVDAIDGAVIDRAAARWTGEAITAARKTEVREVDQWTVAGELRTTRPLFKYSWDDGQQVYVSGTTGEVVQFTTSASRAWAYLGAIPHWLYFTSLRQHPQQWSSVVIWTSLLGTLSAVLGLVVAVWMISPSRQYRHDNVPTAIPYRGWKRWHTIVGLVFGMATVTWAFSGWLSMGPFPTFEHVVNSIVSRDRSSSARADGDRRRTPTEIEAALRGPQPPLSAWEAMTPAMAIASIPELDVRDLALTSFAGAPVYVASNAVGQTRVLPVQGTPAASFPVDRVTAALRTMFGPESADINLLAEYDAYYRDRRRERPLPVLLVKLRDDESTRYYIDPATARVVGSYSDGGWIDRWLYHGLHSLDFPWLYSHRPLWDVVVIAFMIGGMLLSGTSIVLAWQVLARKLVSGASASAAPTDR